MTVVSSDGMREAEGDSPLQPPGDKAITQKNCRSHIMAIWLVSLQAITSEMTTAELDLEARAGLAEIMQPNQSCDPSFSTRQRNWTRHHRQQCRRHSCHIQKVRQQRVSKLRRL